MLKTLREITKEWNWWFIGALIALGLAWTGLYLVCKWTIEYVWAPKGVF